MSLDEQKSKFNALNNWFSTIQGKDVENAFQRELNHLNNLLHGQTLLQLGNCAGNAWLYNLHYTHKWIAMPDGHCANTLQTLFTQLPFDRNSIDCLIAPLTMEAFTHQKNPIDEIDRVLKPMGYVIFFGVNPISLWGLKLRLSHFSVFGELKGRPTSVFFLQRAMSHRSYIQCSLSSFYFIPPVKTSNWLQRLEILNELGKLISPCPPGFYCLVMQKYQENYPNLLISEVEKKSLEKVQVLQPVCQSLETDKAISAHKYKNLFE